MRAQEVAYRFSLLVCGHADDAEDVMQEALLKTYRYVGRIREPEAFRTWLYRTVQQCVPDEAPAPRGRAARTWSRSSRAAPVGRGADARSTSRTGRGRPTRSR